MPPRWPSKIKIQIRAALSECAPECILSKDAVKRLTVSTGLSAQQLQKSAENFRRKTPWGERATSYEATPASPSTQQPRSGRFPDEARRHLQRAAETTMRNGHFDGPTMRTLMSSTGLSATSIRKWVVRRRNASNKIM